MAKLTRKSYKRKKVAFAAVVLGGVALVSSGFAAFVLSAGAEKNVGGNIHVGESVKGALSMEIFNADSKGNKVGDALKADGTVLPDAYFSFDADAKDIEGKTENQGNTGRNGEKVPGVFSNRAYYKETATSKNPEKLSNTFVIEIKSTIDSLSSLNIKLTTSGEGKDFETPINNGFITPPGCHDSAGVTIGESVFDAATATAPAESKKVGNDSYVVTKTGDDAKGYTWTIKYTFAFAWGTRFNNKNPCYFFDNKETSKIDTGVTKTPRSDTEIGNCYGKTDSDGAVTLTPGWDVDVNTIDADWTWLKGKVDGATYNINFSAQAK